jgi:flagellar M-ring protein FliF
MSEGFQRLIEPFMAMSSGKRMMIAFVAFLSVAAFAVLILVANRTDYRPLFTNLNAEDAGEIVKKLKEAKTPYQITADGKGILVPADKVYEQRLTLASEGLPQGGGIGFEIFDRKNFGMTEFVQKINYQRALQGELSRTISQLNGVEQARIHLVLPEKSLFKENEKPATASIVLKMKSNRTLQESEVQGVVHLVSSAIEGMDPDHVTVLDSRGKILSKGNGTSDAASKATTAMQETQRGYEKNVEERIQSLLDRIVGSGKTVARVTAAFDFKQVERVEEKFDPETIAVRSEQRTEEKGASTTSSASVSGVPGVQTNLGKTPPGSASTNIGGAKNDETLNYEVSRSTSKIIEPVGALSKISVAVLVDGKYEAPAAVKDGQPAKAKYVPRSPEELQKIEALVKNAVGFNPERGDQLTVQNIPFQDTGEAGVVEEQKWWSNPFFMSLFKNLMIGVGFLALVFLVIRPLLTSLRIVRPAVFETIESISEGGVGKLSSNERAQIAQQMAEQQSLIESAKKDPYQVAQILQNWMGEDNK